MLGAAHAAHSHRSLILMRSTLVARSDETEANQLPCAKFEAQLYALHGSEPATRETS
jgi:hypothetical protein